MCGLGPGGSKGTPGASQDERFQVWCRSSSRPHSGRAEERLPKRTTAIDDEKRWENNRGRERIRADAELRGLSLILLRVYQRTGPYLVGGGGRQGAI